MYARSTRITVGQSAVCSFRVQTSLPTWALINLTTYRSMDPIKFHHAYSQTVRQMLF